MFVEVQLHWFLTSAVDEGEWSASSRGRFISGTYWTGGWLCPTAGLDAKTFRLIGQDPG